MWCFCVHINMREGSGWRVAGLDHGCVLVVRVSMLVCQYLRSEFSAGGSLDPKGRGNACASCVDEFRFRIEK
jgi:hypothetical protein